VVVGEKKRFLGTGVVGRKLGQLDWGNERSRELVFRGQNMKGGQKRLKGKKVDCETVRDTRDGDAKLGLGTRKNT